MALSTYTDLQTTAAQYLDRTDLTDVLPTFVLLAEAKMRRVLRGAVARASLSVSTAETQLPSDFQEVVSLYLDQSPYYAPLKIVSPGDLHARIAEVGESGVPRYAAVLNRVLMVAPAPDATYTVALEYYADLDALSATNTTNWVLTDHPDAYLFGVLAEAAPYLKHDERIPVWRDQFQAALAEIHDKYARQEVSGDALALRPRRAIG